jgi:hypothetical protein
MGITAIHPPIHLAAGCRAVRQGAAANSVSFGPAPILHARWIGLTARRLSGRRARTLKGAGWPRRGMAATRVTPRTLEVIPGGEWGTEEGQATHRSQHGTVLGYPLLGGPTRVPKTSGPATEQRPIRGAGAAARLVRMDVGPLTRQPFRFSTRPREIGDPSPPAAPSRRVCSRGASTNRRRR